MTTLYDLETPATRLIEPRRDTAKPFLFHYAQGYLCSCGARGTTINRTKHRPECILGISLSAVRSNKPNTLMIMAVMVGEVVQ